MSQSPRKKKINPRDQIRLPGCMENLSLPDPQQDMDQFQCTDERLDRLDEGRLHQSDEGRPTWPTKGKSSQPERGRLYHSDEGTSDQYDKGILTKPSKGGCEPDYALVNPVGYSPGDTSSSSSDEEQHLNPRLLHQTKSASVDSMSSSSTSCSSSTSSNPQRIGRGEGMRRLTASLHPGGYSPYRITEDWQSPIAIPGQCEKQPYWDTDPTRAPVFYQVYKLRGDTYNDDLKPSLRKDESGAASANRESSPEKVSYVRNRAVYSTGLKKPNFNRFDLSYEKPKDLTVQASTSASEPDKEPSVSLHRVLGTADHKATEKARAYKSSLSKGVESDICFGRSKQEGWNRMNQDGWNPEHGRSKQEEWTPKDLSKEFKLNLASEEEFPGLGSSNVKKKNQ